MLRKAQIFASRHRRKSELAEANRRRRHSQVVRQGTANPRFSGSNPDGASIKGPEQKLRAFSFWPPPLPRVIGVGFHARPAMCAGEPTLSFIPGREGVEALPYESWEGGCKQPASSVIRRKGRRGRRPLRWVCDERCGIRRDGAVPSRFTNGARAVPAKYKSLVGQHTVDAPWETRAKSVRPNGYG